MIIQKLFGMVQEKNLLYIVLCTMKKLILYHTTIWQKMVAAKHVGHQLLMEK